MDDVKYKFKAGDRVLLYNFPSSNQYHFGNYAMFYTKSMHMNEGKIMTIRSIKNAELGLFKLVECTENLTYHGDHMRLVKNNYKIMMDFAKQNRS